MNLVYLLLGSNLGNKTANLKKATDALRSFAGTIPVQSHLYASPPWGFEHNEDFVNQAVLLETELAPHELLAGIHDIESEMGRVREPEQAGYQARIIDIDIIYFNRDIIKTASLEIPHPRIHLRRFVLVPLDEIAPDFLHPVLQKTQTQLLKECSDISEVTLIR